MLRFIKKTAFEVWNTRAQFNRSLCIDVEDLVQEGSMGLYDCIEKFDPDSGNQFLTYAVPAIKNAMLDYVRSQSSSFEGKNQSEIMSLDEFAKDEVQSRHTFIPDAATQTPEQVYLAQERLNDLHHALDMIEKRDEQYLRYRFGFDDDIEHPLTETAQHFNLSESRAKKTEALALDNVWLELPWWYEQRRNILLLSIMEALLAIGKMIDE